MTKTVEMHAEAILALLKQDFDVADFEGATEVRSWQDVIATTCDDVADEYVLDAAVAAFGYDTARTLFEGEHFAEYVDDVLKQMNVLLALTPLYIWEG